MEKKTTQILHFLPPSTLAQRTQHEEPMTLAGPSTTPCSSCSSELPEAFAARLLPAGSTRAGACRLREEHRCLRALHIAEEITAFSPSLRSPSAQLLPKEQLVQKCPHLPASQGAVWRAACSTCTAGAETLPLDCSRYTGSQVHLAHKMNIKIQLL